ncbi:MAG: flagellar biosynthesis protein FlhF [Nitrospinaceae bacterium]|nr:MAG: flagellar biosynthesis protein FlhF [Nitrospinaceae bacterium]
MRIRKFLAPSYSEALTTVKKELGEDALVLSTRSLSPGEILGQGKNVAKVEITAAFEPSEKKEPAIINGAPWQEETPLSLKEDDLDLKRLIFSLLTRTEKAQSMGLKSHQLETYSRLVEEGLNERLASKIVETANKKNPEEIRDPQTERQTIVDLMKRVLRCDGAIKLDGKRTKKVMFVGPTGAGKTTTIAKLAADYALRQKKKVAMMTLDTYRIGAIDQLRIYGEIMGVPVESASNRKELQAIVRKHQDKDLLLIDTMGRNHKDKSYSGQLKVMLNALGSVETQLVLSLTTQEKILQEAVKQFSLLGIDRVLFTKMDEAVSFGSLINFSLRTRIPFSYFAVGQKVPEDIEVANKEKVIKLIFN